MPYRGGDLAAVQRGVGSIHRRCDPNPTMRFLPPSATPSRTHGRFAKHHLRPTTGRPQSGGEKYDISPDGGGTCPPERVLTASQSTPPDHAMAPAAHRRAYKPQTTLLRASNIVLIFARAIPRAVRPAIFGPRVFFRPTRYLLFMKLHDTFEPLPIAPRYSVLVHCTLGLSSVEENRTPSCQPPWLPITRSPCA